jgi:hypothetical protein
MSDAALVRACAEFCDLLREEHDAHDRLQGEELDAAVDELCDLQETQLNQIARLRARTIAGHRARAKGAVVSPRSV